MGDAGGPIEIGARIGPYEILGWLGAGGMGVVYRARDIRLARDVAIKLIPDPLASDPSRVQRFEQEARAAGQLNHPNILAVYDVGIHAGVPYIVSELLDGESLRSLLRRGPMPRRKAIDYARQAAEGLAAAHDRNIVHRDVKPDNLFVTNDDRLKILDFGLAKLTRPSDAVATLDTNLKTETMAGTMVGTAAYMSPEQVRGELVDPRSDIFSVGTVLCEMLAGRPAFTRETAVETMAAILNDDPHARLPTDISAPLARIVARCLEKRREARFQSARDLAFALEVLSDPSVAMPAPAAGRSERTRRVLPWMVVALLLLGLAGVTVWMLRRPPPPVPVTRLSLTLPELQTMAGNRRNVALSPDGARVVYVAGNRLNIRSMSSLEAEPVPGSEGFQQVDEPVFSPDGRSIVFFAFGDRALKRIAVAGGAAVTLCPVEDPDGINWGTDGIVVGQGSKGIVRVSSNGGPPETIVRVKDGELASAPQVLPDGRHVLFTLASGTGPDRWDGAHIVVQSLTSGERRTLIRGGSDARYMQTGHLVYAVSGRLFAIAFDPRRLEVKGDAVAVVEGVSRATAGTTSTASYSASSNGTLVYLPGPIAASSAQVAVVDRSGGVERLNITPGPYMWPRISPDGTKVAFGIDDGKEAAVWIQDLSGTQTMRRLTFGGHNRFPIWTADGRRVAFQSDRDGDVAVFWQPADGNGTAERLTTAATGESHAPESWSPKNDAFLFSVSRESDVALWVSSVREGKARPFGGVTSTNSVSAAASFSPDGQWIAYTSNQSGRTTIYVQPFPATGATYQLFARESDDPHHPAWSPDGRELFYVSRPGGFASVSVSKGPTVAFGNPRTLPNPFLLGSPSWRRSFDVTPDGKILGLLLGQGLQAAPGTSGHQLHVVLHWFDELAARVPASR
jgi:serine/threonine-protein kinase